VSEVKIHNGSLYSYSAGLKCGVLVREKTMRKLVKIQNDHMQKVKALLTNEADKGRVFPSMWTLHYPEGKQTAVHFIDTEEDLKRAIDNSVYSARPIHRDLVFIASSMDEAKKMADAYSEGGSI